MNLLHHTPLKVAIVAPSPVPYGIGGAENLWWGLLAALNQAPGVQAELIKLPSPERNLTEILSSYLQYATLNLDHFDVVISTKYPAWAIKHRCHIIYLQHTLRGLYDTYNERLPHVIASDELLQLEHWGLKPTWIRALACITEVGTTIQSLGLHPDDLPEMIRGFQACMRHDPQAALWRFPGPVAKAMVWLMDHVAMDASRIRHHAAISQTVAARAGYFPPGVTPAVYYHPTALTGLQSTGCEYIFSASRLVADKRIDWIVKAYQASGVNVPLKIAGTGPMEASLKELAKDTPGIEFLGRLTDEELVRAYSKALCVPFVSFKEDYGLITIEAFGAGKPVITTQDAGGPTEWVKPGITGWIAESNPQALAKALQEACADRAGCVRMGEAAQAAVSHLDWDHLIAELLTLPGPTGSLVLSTNDAWGALVGDLPRPDLLMLNSYPITPVVSGGQLRLAGLYGALAKTQVVHALTVGGMNTARKVCAQFTEEVIAKTPALLSYEKKLSLELGVSCGDIAIAFQPESLPTYYEALKKACVGVPTIVCAHPYMYPMVARLQAEGHWQGRLIYEAHNVEYQLKADMYQLDWAKDAVKRLEAACYQAADLVTVCSEEDGQAMRALYGERSQRVIPNGIDPRLIQFIAPKDRLILQQKASKSLSRLMALFMGSDHAPNREALDAILKAAPLCPNIDFVVMGSVGKYLEKQILPENLRCTGLISDAEKAQYLAIADIGLNPMRGGSGTNLKMSEYAAAGLWMVSTKFGARGFWEAGVHYSQVRYDHLAIDLQALLQSQVHQERMIVDAYIQVRTCGDWAKLATTFAVVGN
jgi:glycosyltransferase involved in cell wall biosynthesis